MNEQESVRCCGASDDREGATQRRISRHSWLFVSMAVAFTVCSPLPGEAVNGEPVGAEGLHRTTGACAPGPDVKDFTISCDDRPAAGVVSCHMRRPNQPLAKDEGLAINTCVDGRVATGSTALGATQEFLESDVEIRATDFGEFVCGKELGEAGAVNFCLVCDTFVDDSVGASHCVKIVTDNPAIPTPDGQCGAFDVSTDSEGACSNAQLQLRQFFSDPRVGFTIGINGNDAGYPAGTQVEDPPGVFTARGKDLLVCGSRSWQCIDVRPRPLVTQAQQIQEQQTHALIDTPCCMRLASGRYYCSTTLTPSATCK
jgi:hypothetical protein